MSSGSLVLAGRAWAGMLRGPDFLRWTAIGLFLAIGIGLRSPWPADEPRFALAAIDMVMNHHWLLPHRGGEIYADKPPVFMWLQALLFSVTGNMRIAFLLPSLLASMATLWMVHDLTRRLFGRDEAWFAVLVLLTTVQFTLQAKTAQIDATLTAFTTLGLYGLLRYHCTGSRPRWYAIAWLAMGVGVITKGVGFLPVFLLPGLYLALRRQQSTGSRPSSWTVRLSPLLILLPAALWLLPLFFAAYVGERQDIAAYLNELLFRQTITRYAGGLGHSRPAWYYLTNVIPLLWMPLSVLLVWLVPDWLRRLRERSVVHWSLVGFVVLSLAFFTLSPGKRGVYLLPLLSALAILAGGSLPALVDRRSAITALRAISLVLGVVLVAAAAATSFELKPLTAFLARSDMYVLPTMLFLLASGTIWILAAILIRNGGAFTLAMMVSWLLMCVWGYTLLEPVRSAGELMSSVESRLGPRSELAVVGFREQQLLQARRDVVHWGYRVNTRSQAVDAARWLRERGDRYVLVSDELSDACFGSGAGEWLGYRHRRDWRLVTSADIDEVTCLAPAANPVRYLAPYVEYPHGKR